jgi:TP901 family phage tail tape measure protein
MAITTKAKAILEFQSNTQQVDEFLKRLQTSTSNINISDSLRQDFKTLEVELEQLMKQASDIDTESITPDLAATFLKKYQGIYGKANSLNQKLLKEVTQSSNTQIDILDQRIKVLSKDVAIESKELLALQEKFPESQTSPDSVEFASERTEMRFTKELATSEGLLEKMKGASGQLITNFRSMLDNADALEDTLGSVDGVQDKINEGLEKGLSVQEISKTFSEDEREEMQLLLAEKHKNFDLETALEQIEVKRQLDLKKANFLYEKRNEISEKQNALDVKKDELDTKSLKKQEEIKKATQGMGVEQEKLLAMYRDFDSQITKGSAEGSTSLKELGEAARRAAASQKQLNEENKKQTGTLAKATKQVFNYGIAFTALRRIYRETLRTVKDLDSALTEMAIVTSMNRKEAWQLVGTMQQLAKETGFTTTEIAKLSTIYFRQGRTLREVVELTRVAAQAARIAGISAAQSADFLTSAINAFQLSADQALAVSDRFAALAAQSASSYEELAVGLSKFAAQANIAGISIDFAMGLLSKGIETTREAPETIGTALKTVIARMRELTDLGKTFEDGMDISRVETALRQVGVALRDEQGQFRNLELVLTELGGKFETLNTNQQASVAVALAGTRQQSRLIAIMQDFDRTLELVDIAQESAGATMAQHTQFMKGMEAASIGLQTAYQKFITTITESEFIIGVVRALGSAIEAIANGFERIGFVGQTSMIILTALFVVMKTGKTIMQIMTKLTGKQITLDTIKNKLTLAELKTTKLGIFLIGLKNKIIEANSKLSLKSLTLTNLQIKAQALHTLIINKLTKAKVKLGVATKFLGKGFLFLAKAMLLNPLM